MNHEQEGVRQPEGRSPREILTVVNSYNLEMKIFANTEDISFETDDSTITIPTGSAVADISFTPFTREYSESHPTQTIASGIMGMNNIMRFFEYSKEQNLPIPKPEYLIGHTGKDMARFARRFGFHTKAVEDDQVYRVVGKFDEVKEKLVSFITSDGGERAKAIFDRAHRDNPEFWELATHPALPQVTIAELPLPTNEELDILLHLLQREMRKEESFLKKVRIGVYTILGANLGLSIENIAQGNYVAGGIGAGFSLASATVVGSLEYRRQKRNKAREENRNQ